MYGGNDRVNKSMFSLVGSVVIFFSLIGSLVIIILDYSPGDSTKVMHVCLVLLLYTHDLLRKGWVEGQRAT